MGIVLLSLRAIVQIEKVHALVIFLSSDCFLYTFRYDLVCIILKKTKYPFSGALQYLEN